MTADYSYPLSYVASPPVHFSFFVRDFYSQRLPLRHTKEYPTRQYSSMPSIMRIQHCRRRIFSPIFTRTTMVELPSTGTRVSSTAPFRPHRSSTHSSVFPKSTFTLCQCTQRLSSTPTAGPYPLHYLTLIIAPVPSCFYLSCQTGSKSFMWATFGGTEMPC